MAVVKRLSKVARELNVGISTIVEFLGSKGKELSSNPNTKIGEDLYMILLEEYQKEKFEKEKADNVVIDQPERKVISIKKEEPKKQVEKIVANANLISRPSVLGKIDLSSKSSKSEPVKEEVKEEKIPEPIPSNKDSTSEEIASVSETIKAEAKKLSGPKVLGKIELPKVSEKTKPTSDDDSDSSKRKRKRIKKVNV